MTIEEILKKVSRQRQQMPKLDLTPKKVYDTHMIKVKKSVAKEVEKLPRQVRVLYRTFLAELQRDGLGVQGWDLKKMAGKDNLYRAKLNYSYRVVIEFIKPDLIIITVASREGVYK